MRTNGIVCAKVSMDIAKHVFQALGVHPAGHVLFRKRLRRVKLLAFFATTGRARLASLAYGAPDPDLAGLYFRAARSDPRRLCV